MAEDSVQDSNIQNVRDVPSHANVVIIGGGITGMTAAYLLAKQGIQVLVLEKTKICGGVTSRTTGELTQLLDARTRLLVKLIGKEATKELHTLHAGAISGVETIVQNEKIACDFSRCTNYVYGEKARDKSALQKIAREYSLLGLDARFVQDDAFSIFQRERVEIKNQAKFNAEKYVHGLFLLAQKYGANICEGVEVETVQDDAAGVTVRLKSGQIISGDKVFMASHLPVVVPKEMEHKYNMYRSHVVWYEMPKGLLPVGIYQDLEHPYHYFRIDTYEDHDRIFLGGADHMAVLGVNGEAGRMIIGNYAAKLLKNITYTETSHWSGLIANPLDGLPFIGPIEGGNIFYASGFSGNGMTYSYIAAHMFAEWINGRTPEFMYRFAPERKIPWWVDIFA